MTPNIQRKVHVIISRHSAVWHNAQYNSNYIILDSSLLSLYKYRQNGTEIQLNI